MSPILFFLLLLIFIINMTLCYSLNVFLPMIFWSHNSTFFYKQLAISIDQFSMFPKIIFFSYFLYSFWKYFYHFYLLLISSYLSIVIFVIFFVLFLILVDLLTYLYLFWLNFNLSSNSFVVSFVAILFFHFFIYHFGHFVIVCWFSNVSQLSFRHF